MFLKAATSAARGFIDGSACGTRAVLAVRPRHVAAFAGDVIELGASAFVPPPGRGLMDAPVFQALSAVGLCVLFFGAMSSLGKNG
jgi:hypothetical protein